MSAEKFKKMDGEPQYGDAGSTPDKRTSPVLLMVFAVIIVLAIAYTAFHFVTNPEPHRSATPITGK